MAKSTAKRKLVGILTVLGLLVPGLLVALTLAPPAQAEIGPNPHASLKVVKTFDGTGHGTPGQTFVNTFNGFTPGDDTSTDGVVSSQDTVGYEVSLRVEAGPARTVAVKIATDPGLEWKTDRAGFCADLPGVSGTLDSANDQCLFLVAQGATAQITRTVILTAKDSSGLALSGQRLRVDVGLESQTKYATVASEPVTVVSAPTADLRLVQPAQLNYASATGGTVKIVVDSLSRPGFSPTKGASALTPWTAQVDVSSFPAGTTWRIGPTNLPVDDGKIEVGPISGDTTIAFTFPGNTPPPLAPGEVVSWDLRLIVPSTAFSTDDFLNNGTGWQPGDGKGSGHSTYDAALGSKSGSPYPNNDWTRISLYRNAQIPGSIFSKQLARPYTSNRTLFESGNMHWGASSGPGWSSLGNPQKVAPTTQLRADLVINSPAITGNPAQLAVADVWDPAQQVPDGNVWVSAPDGSLVHPSQYTVYWSTTATKVNTNVADPNDLDGWVQLAQHPVNASGVKVVFKTGAILTGSQSGAGVYRVTVPLRTLDLPKTAQPLIVDRGYVYVTGGQGSFLQDNAVMMVWPSTPVLALAHTVTPGVDFAGKQLSYTVKPTITDPNVMAGGFNATVTVTLDRCVFAPVNTSEQWAMSYTPPIPGPTGRVCGDPDSTPGVLVFRPTNGSIIYASGFNPNTRVASLPTITYKAQSRLAAQNAVVNNGHFEVGGLGSEVTPATADASSNILAASASSAKIDSDPKKVEIEDSLHWTVDLVAAMDATQSSATVIALPRTGDGADYFSLVDNPGSYPGAQSSDFSGNVELTSASFELDDTTDNAVLYYTTAASPVLDPDSVAEVWLPVAGATPAQLANATALKVEFQAQAGRSNAKLRVSMQPSGNTTDDVYLLWGSQTKFSGPGNGLGAPSPWPAQVEVVSSKISGTIWRDEDSNAVMGSGEPRIADVEIGLFGLHPDGAPGEMPIRTTTTDSAGYYEFTDLRAGSYVTRILDRGPNLPDSLVSYYNDSVGLKQTYSFKGKTHSRSSETSSRIILPVDSTQVDVDFGFFQPNPKVDVDKKNVSTLCADGVCELVWSVDLKNLSNVDIVAGTLTDTMSSSVYDVRAFFGEHQVVKVTQIDEGLALMSDGGVYAWGVGTSGLNGNGGNYPNVVARPVLTAAGTPLTGVQKVVRQGGGGFALMQDGRVFAWGLGGSGANGNGYSSGASAINWYAKPVLTAANTPLTGVVDVVRKYSGGYALLQDGSAYAWGWGVNGMNGNGSQSDNLYAQPIMTSASTQLSGVKQLFDRYIYGGAALMTDGQVYSWGRGAAGGNGNGSIADNMYAQPVLTAANTPLTGVAKMAMRGAGGHVARVDGSVYSWGWGNNGGNGNGGTSHNYYAQPVLTDASTPLIGVKDVGARLMGGGVALHNDGRVSSWGSGDYGANGNGGTSNNLYAAEVLSAASTPLTGVDHFATNWLLNAESTSAVMTDGRAYSWGRGDYGANGNGDSTNNEYAQPVLTAANTPLTGVRDLVNRGTGGLALTTDGIVQAWGRGSQFGNGNGDSADNLFAEALLSSPIYPPNLGPFGVLGEDTTNYVPATAVAPTSVTNQGTLTDRTYAVGLIPAGQTVTVELRGKINQSYVPINVLNQAWFTSSSTPIAGLLPGGQLKPTGPTNPGGALNPLGIPGNPTCNTDADPGGQAVADSCDQVPVQVAQGAVMPGSVSGTVWADANGDGTKGVGEQTISQVPVSLYDGDTLVGESITDANGGYLFVNVPPRSGYQVAFGIQGLAPSNAVLNALGLDTDKTWSYGYTTRAASCSLNLSCAHPSTQRTWPVTVSAGAQTQHLNAGVVLANAGLSVVKTSTAGDPATLQVRPDGTTAPTPVTMTWTNEGSEPLRDLGWEDTTFVGPDLTGITCEYAGSPIDQTTVLPVGESVDCVGTLPSMDLGASHEDEFTVTGVGTVSGTPVAASDRWQAVTNGAASWTMSKTSDPASGTEVKPGSDITYTLQVTNTGDLNLSDLMVTDDLSQVLNQAAMKGDLPDGVQRSGTTLFWNVPLLGPGQSMSISYTVKIDDHAWKKTVLNKAYGSGAVEPAQCMVSRPCQTTHSTPEQPKAVDPPADPPGDDPPPPTTKKPIPHKLPDTGASVTLGMLLLALGLVTAGGLVLTRRRRQG